MWAGVGELLGGGGKPSQNPNISDSAYFCKGAIHQMSIPLPWRGIRRRGRPTFSQVSTNLEMAFEAMDVNMVFRSV